MKNVYDVTLDGVSTAQFSSITKAKAHARTLRGKGKVTIYHSMIDDDKSPAKPSSVTKKAKKPSTAGKVTPKAEKPAKPKKAKLIGKRLSKASSVAKKTEVLPKAEKPMEPKGTKTVVKKAEKPTEPKRTKTVVKKTEKPKTVPVKPKADDRFGDPKTYVKAWYMGAFPGDRDVFSDLRPDATFGDVLRATIMQKDVYDVFGVNDSTVRERIFDELAGRNGVPYDTIYDCWMGETSWSPADVGDDGIVKKRPVAPVVKKPAEKPPAPEKPKASPKAPKRSTAKKAPTNEQFLKKLAGLLHAMGNTNVPVYVSKFAVVSPDHGCAVCMRNPNGTSLFGLPDNGQIDHHVDLDKVVSKPGPYTVEGGTVAGVPIDDYLHNAFFDKLLATDYSDSYELDPAAFERLIARTPKIFQLSSPARRMGQPVRLECDGEDLYASSDNAVRSFRVDIGDGTYAGASTYSFYYIQLASKFLSMTDGPYRILFKDGYPLRFESECNGWEMTMFIAGLKD